MTNRFFRNAVGVAALTSLALGLACSGSSDPDPVAPPATVNKPGTPIVSISGLTASNNAITKHQYLISASDPSGLATSFSISGSPAGSTFKEISKGMWTYIPATAGNEIITVKATNASGTSDGGGVMASVVANQQIQNVSGTSVPAGETKTVSLPDKDSDGDALVWTVTDKGGLVEAKVVDNHQLTITTGADAKDKYDLKLKATERYPNANGYEVDTKDYAYTVTISAGGSNTDEWGPWGDQLGKWAQGNSKGKIDAFPNNSDQTAYGVPFTFQFNASDSNIQNNKVVWWGVNGGIGPTAPDYDAEPQPFNIPPPASWIGQPAKEDGEYRRPDIGKLGNAFERWRMGVDFQNGLSNNRIKNFPAGRLFFVPQDTDYYSYYPDSYSSRSLFGVRADFRDGEKVTAYQDFYIKVTDNTPPSRVLVGSNAGEPYTAYGDAAGRITTYVLNKRPGIDPRADENVPLTVPWIGKPTAEVKAGGVSIGVGYGGERKLVFRHPNDDYSYDLAASISLSHIQFADIDIAKYGDVITFMLDGVTYGNNRSNTSGGTSTPFQYRTSTQSSRLQGGSLDVTAAIRPYLSRPYPINGTDLMATKGLEADAIRTFVNDGKSVTSTVYLEGVDDEYYENGKKQNVYRAHAAADNTVYLDYDNDFNARGNLRGVDSGSYPDAVSPSPIQFVKVPKANVINKDDWDGSNGLTFHYTAIDLKGNPVYFEIYVPTRDNYAPQLDEFCWDEDETGTATAHGAADPKNVTHGDLVGQRAFPSPKPEVWASIQPSEGETTTWRFQWNDSDYGTDPVQYYIGDPNAPGQVGALGAGTSTTIPVADPIYLMVPPGKQVDNFGGPTNPVASFKPDTLHTVPTAFEVSWKPTIYQGRKDYAYTIYGWDKYGAGMRPFPMAGKVWGALKGTPIYKKLYNNGEVVAAGPANLTIKGYARVSVNPFFNEKDFPIENKLYNQYGFDSNESWLSSPTVGRAEPWEVSVIPPNTPLLISAARTTASSGDAIQFPVIGPSVVSANWVKVGSRFASIEKTNNTSLTAKEASKVPSMSWETGNLISYAYIEPDQAQDAIAATDPYQRVQVDLTAHVGSGQLAHLTDPSLNNEDVAGAQLYVTGIDLPKPWGVQNAATADDDLKPDAGTGPGSFDYHGYMYRIGSYSTIKDAVIQVAMPSVGQSAFFHVEDPDETGGDWFPSTAYANRLGWFNQPLVSTDNNPQSNMGGSFEPIVLPIFPASASNMTNKLYAKYIDWTEDRSAPTGPGHLLAHATDAQTAPAWNTDLAGLPYTFHIGEDGNPNYTLVSLKRTPVGTAFYNTGSNTSGSVSVNIPVWVVQRTGKPTWADDGSVLDFDNDFSWLGSNTNANVPSIPAATSPALWQPDGYADNNELYLGHHSNWDDLSSETFGTFRANINRDSFGGNQGRLWSVTSKLPGASTTVADTNIADGTWRAGVTDTLQVLSYVSGTELGPDNHQALPVLLEFGNLNDIVVSDYNVANSTLTAAQNHNLNTKFRGRYDFSSFPIYKPTMWPSSIEDGKSVPVVSYIARYTDQGTANFTGTMGLITDTLNAATFAFPSGFGPITDLKITATPDWAQSATAGDAAEYARGDNTRNTRRGTNVSNFLAGYTTVTTNATTPGTFVAPPALPTGAGYLTRTVTNNTATTPLPISWNVAYNVAPALVYAKAYNDGGNGDTENPSHYKVWLSWNNPAAATTAGLSNHDKPNISGNIIEFFNVSDFSTADTAESAVPIYKVYVGPNVNAFPIPDAWLPFLGYTGNGNTFDLIDDVPSQVVIRMRTVRYGDKTKGNFVNFNVEPFKQALPAAWIDTLTTKISFANVGSSKVRIASEAKIWAGWPKDYASATVLTMHMPDPLGGANGFATPADITVWGTAPDLADGTPFVITVPASVAAGAGHVKYLWETDGRITATITDPASGSAPAGSTWVGQTTATTAVTAPTPMALATGPFPATGVTVGASSTPAAATVSTTSATLGTTTNLTIPASLLQGIFTNMGRSFYPQATVPTPLPWPTATITVPIKLTISYDGSNGDATPREFVQRYTVTFVVRGAAVGYGT